MDPNIPNKGMKKFKPSMRLKLISLFSIILLFFLFSLVLSLSNSQKINESAILLDKEYKWDKIQLLIGSNILSAEKELLSTTEDISNKLKLSYEGRMDELKEQIENPNSESELSAILRGSIEGNYLNNVESDKYSQMVISNEDIIADNSTNIREGYSVRKISEESKYVNNKKLAEEAYRSLKFKNSSEPIFLDKVINRESKIEEMSMEELKRVFLEDGVEALRDVTFLVPGYITERGDIFGVPDSNNLGVRQDNNKIIVVQRFNIYDIISKDHKVEEFDSIVSSELVKDIKDRDKVNLSLLFLVLFITLSLVIIIFYNIHIEYEKVKLEEYTSYPRSLDDYIDKIKGK